MRLRLPSSGGQEAESEASSGGKILINPQVLWDVALKEQNEESIFDAGIVPSQDWHMASASEMDLQSNKDFDMPPNILTKRAAATFLQLGSVFAQISKSYSINDTFNVGRLEAP